MNREIKPYFTEIPKERQAHFKALHELIVSLFPQIQISMRFKMPTYELGQGWVAIANQKNYISLYTCGEHHLREFKGKHPKIKTGKGCINFKPGSDLPLTDIKQVIRHAIEHSEP